jgi:hypothetical protein
MSIPDEWTLHSHYLRELRENLCVEAQLPNSVFDTVVEQLAETYKMYNNTTGNLSELFLWAVSTNSIQSLDLSDNTIIDWLIYADYLRMDDSYTKLKKHVSQYILPKMVYSLPGHRNP